MKKKELIYTTIILFKQLFLLRFLKVFFFLISLEDKQIIDSLTGGVIPAFISGLGSNFILNLAMYI